jgi:hypothetical protein
MISLENVVWLLLIMGAGAFLAIICIVTGGWIVFKSKTAGPGTPFIGRPPKGEVFTVQSADDADGFPEEVADKGMLARTEEMLSKLTGGGKR